MAYVSAEARQRLLDTVVEATDQIAIALAALGEAYEQLDEQRADALEEALFRPVQGAYGRAKRTHAEFAARHALPAHAFAPAPNRTLHRSPHEVIEGAIDALAEAELILSELQDSMLPVEVGDAEVRAGLAEVRELLTPLPGRAHEMSRRFGR
jgi:hypothetical protein